jgi:hypothetical protein
MMGSRRYFFFTSAPRLFLASMFYFFLMIVALMALIGPLDDPKHNSPLWLLLGIPGVPLFGYMAVGAFINACRLVKAWFATMFGWKA